MRKLKMHAQKFKFLEKYSKWALINAPSPTAHVHTCMPHVCTSLFQIKCSCTGARYTYLFEIASWKPVSKICQKGPLSV